MLDRDYERALTEIEQQLHAEDPEFVRTFAGERAFPTALVLAAGLYITMPIVALLFGPRTALFTLAAGGLIAVVIWCGRRT
ncbi:DUF3040 domain-containing protein [Actinoplanes sp. NPDC026619]|uniref:DUF3040 domain-containing protein n=1 Tax=Actinoplanes sp. NPDC026619 TaxID=3155798 RepID=UPI0033F87CA5